MTNSITDKSYLEFLNDLKQRVVSARYKAALSVNRELVLLYHHIGTKILESQRQHGWGAKIVEQLSHDLRNAFPEMKGFSRTNLLYMRKFAEEYPDLEFVQSVSAQLSWSHNVALLDKVTDKKIRNFYLSVVDDLLRHPTDNPSIGLVLCKSKNNVLVEYALRDMSKPIGLSEYQLTKAIPDQIKTSLPTIEVLEAELRKIGADVEEGGGIWGGMRS